MSPAYHRIKLYTVIHLLFFGASHLSLAQNIAPNPSFEEYSLCPLTPAWYFTCYPWHTGSEGTPDYFNACSNPSNVGVPDNYAGFQPALSGDGYAGIIGIALQHNEAREYIQTELESTMIAGKWYYVSFYVNLSDDVDWQGNNNDCGIEQIGAYFSEDPPVYVQGNVIDVIPQVESSEIYYSDTANWMLVEGCFRAVGDEAIITIGNFHNNDNTNIDTACAYYPYEAYYFIDDVFVGEVTPGGVDLELDGPVSACDSYTINPGIHGVEYYWEDGSSETTFTVTTSGTYSLTVYDGCNAGVDSIEVEIINAPDNLIAEDEITVCQGETVVVSLDPDLNEFTWGDGSHAIDYVIATTGIYTVTLDDGCDITTDQIEVTVLDPPSPFSLGGDTILCTGSEIEINFDPDLGEFLWQNNSNSNFFVITQSGTYAVTITNMCGEASAELDVMETTPAYVSLWPNFDTLCTGEVIEITLDPIAGTYVWQDGSTNPTYQISTGGLYTVTMSHYCGESSDWINVVALATPSFDLGDTIQSCYGESWTLAITNWIGEYTWSDGSDTNFIVVNTSGTYSLTIENSCGVDSGDIVLIYEDTLVPPSLGPDFSLCPGEETTLFANTPGASFTWQDMSTADTLLVNAAGTYHVMVSNSCQSLTDTVVVSVQNSPPVITLPDQLTLCQGNSQVLDPGVNGVTYDWSDGTHLSTLVVINPGQYSLTVTNSCGTDIDTVTILDGGPVPFVSLGADTSICSGAVLNLYPVSSNVTSWLWPDGSVSNSFATSVAGTVFVEVANSCGTAYDTMLFSVLPLTPALSLGPDVDLCPGTTLNIFITEPNVDILWPDGSTENHFVVSDSITQVCASITNGCGSSADTVEVSLLPAAPLLDLGVDQSLCPGEIISIDPGIQGVNYLWQDGSTGTSFQTTQQATIILTVSNVCGASTDTMEITESTNGPHVDLGPDVHGCIGEAITIPAGISGVTYNWQDGTTDDTFIATTSGWVHLTVTNLCGTDIDSLLVDLSGTVPTPYLGMDTSLCEGATLWLVSNSDASTSIEWQDGTALNDFLVTAAGIYTLTETNECGFAADEIVVSYNPLPVEVNLGLDISLCPGESVVLMAPQTSDLLRWQDGSSAVTMVVDQAQIYSLHISNSCGTTSDSLVVYVNADVPQINIPTPIPWCPGEQITLDAEQSFAATYLWSTGQIDPSITISTPGIYSVEVSATCSTSSGQVEVIVHDDCGGEANFYIPNVFSPNDDQVNDKFILSFHGDLQVTSIEGSIFDRWGNLVYLSEGISFEWDGRFNQEAVMPGVYVYFINLTYIFEGKEHVEVISGNVTVLR